jgi:hypothetical protein
MIISSSLFFFAAALVLVVATSSSSRHFAAASFCHNNSRTGSVNDLVPDSAAATARLVASTADGQLYQVGSATAAEGSNVAYILHIWSDDPVARGTAYGKLLGPRINQTLATAYARITADIVKNVEKKVSGLPVWLAALIVDLGVDYALDELYRRDLPSMEDTSIFDEMKAMCAAAPCDFDLARRMAFFGELVKAGCSVAAAEGPATLGGARVWLRAFDWETKLGLQNNPVVTVYHASPASGKNDFVNVAWAGYLGSLTTVSRVSGTTGRLLAIGTIGVTDPCPNFGKDCWTGYPFVLLHRWMAETKATVQEIINTAQAVNRTCSIFLGGQMSTTGSSASDGPGSMVSWYSCSQFLPYTNPAHVAPIEPWHPPVNGTLYQCMDCWCPAFQRKMAEQLTLYQSKLTPALIYQNVTSFVETGNLQVLLCDLETGDCFYSNARKDTDIVGSEFAYGRKYISFNLNTLFDLKPLQ